MKARAMSHAAATEERGTVVNNEIQVKRLYSQ